MMTTTNNSSTSNDLVEIHGLPLHLQCRTTPHAGRIVITTKPIAKGSVALCERPYAHTVHYRHKRNTCDDCFGFSSSAKGDEEHQDDDESSTSSSTTALEYPCLGNCGIYYCSVTCRDTAHAMHQASGACSLTRQVQVTQNGQNGNGNGNGNCGSGGKSKGKKSKGKGKNKLISKSMNTALSLLTSINSNGSQRPIADLLRMMQDPSKKARKDSVQAEKLFRALDHSHLKTNANHTAAGDSNSMGIPTSSDSKNAKKIDDDDDDDNDMPLQDILLQTREGVYAEAYLTARLNAIGMYNDAGEELGFCLAPILAMVNHSCLPNCQQLTRNGTCSLVALYDIPAGEELSYSYVSLNNKEYEHDRGNEDECMNGTTTSSSKSSDGNEERRNAIRQNWNFTCTCRRCLGRHQRDCQDFDAEYKCYCGAICLEVDRSCGVCICNPATV